MVAYFHKDSVIKGVSLVSALTLDRCHSTRQKKKKKMLPLGGVPKRTGGRA